MRIRIVDLTRPVGDGTEGYPGDRVAVRLAAAPEAGEKVYDACDSSPVTGGRILTPRSTSFPKGEMRRRFL